MALILHPLADICKTDGFLAVDVAKTFMPGGELTVSPGSDEIVPVCVRVARMYPESQRFACLDKHNLGHVSFASSYVGFDLKPYTKLTVAEVVNWGDSWKEHLSPVCAFKHVYGLRGLLYYLVDVGGQMLWPDHGIIGNESSEMHPDLAEVGFNLVLAKGSDPLCDSYSAFRDNLGRTTGLGEYFKGIGIRRIVMVGLAFDYCVGLSALDAAAAGFEVFVLMDGTRSVSDIRAKFMAKRLADAGVHMCDSGCE